MVVQRKMVCSLSHKEDKSLNALTAFFSHMKTDILAVTNLGSKELSFQMWMKCFADILVRPQTAELNFVELQ